MRKFSRQKRRKEERQCFVLDMFEYIPVENQFGSLDRYLPGGFDTSANTYVRYVLEALGYMIIEMIAENAWVHCAMMSSYAERGNACDDGTWVSYAENTDFDTISASLLSIPIGNLSENLLNVAEQLFEKDSYVNEPHRLVGECCVDEFLTDADLAVILEYVTVVGKRIREYYQEVYEQASKNIDFSEYDYQTNECGSGKNDLHYCTIDKYGKLRVYFRKK